MSDMPAVTPPDPEPLEEALWRAGNAALASTAADRGEVVGALSDVLDVVRLWRSGKGPDRRAWPWAGGN